MQLPVTNIPAQSPQTQPKYRFGEQPRMAGTIPVWHPKGDFAAHLNPNQSAQSSSEPPISFGDFIDIINPLHHLPIIGHLYRNITGDEIAPIARIAGGALFGGLAGAGGAIATLAFNDMQETSHTPTHNFAESPRTAGTLRPDTAGTLRPHTATTLATAQSIAQTPLA